MKSFYDSGEKSCIQFRVGHFANRMLFLPGKWQNLVKNGQNGWI